MVKKLVFLSFSILCFEAVWNQQPNYTFKHFVRYSDTSEFKSVHLKGKNGLIRTFIESPVEVWDVDDDNTTYVKGTRPVLLCIEGQQKNGNREGVFFFYLIDSLDHSRRYKIMEQEFAHDKLNGQWRTYTLKGALVKFDTFKEDSLDGVSRVYWIDGRKIMDEKEFLGSSTHFIQREYYDNGKLKEEATILNGEVTGVGKRYYESGILKEEAVFKNAQFDGTRKYYFPNGQLWIEQIYKAGKPWTVVANYTDKGQKRDAGTLKDGNGTVVFYNEDGTVRETVTYQNGEEIK
jgi:antitoxin component YwqK of YwqJK toxin-antitoxin module